MRLLAATFVLIAALVFLAFGLPRLATASERSWPVTGEAMRWRAPAGFILDALCLHRHESVDWHRAYVDWQGHPSMYSGGLQFLLDTWRRAGGRGHAWQWAPREQVYRAFVIWDMQDGVRGNRRGDWSEWGTARKCGLR